MRPPLLLLVSLLAPADPASAQVTVDLRALDALPNARPPITRPAPAATGAPARAHARSPAASAATGTSTASAQGASTAATGSKPVGQASTPAAGTATASAATAAAPSVPDSKLPAGAPPAEPTGVANPNVMADATPAPGPSGPVAAAVRVMFAPGQGELAADGTSVIKELVASAPAGDSTTFNVVAYAAPTPDDPSAARRLSLSRALAVRNVLMASGVPSSRIYVRALGGQAGDGPADRADVSVLGGNAPPPASAKPQ